MAIMDVHLHQPGPLEANHLITEPAIYAKLNPEVHQIVSGQA